MSGFKDTATARDYRYKRSQGGYAPTPCECQGIPDNCAEQHAKKKERCVLYDLNGGNFPQDPSVCPVCLESQDRNKARNKSRELVKRNLNLFD